MALDVGPIPENFSGIVEFDIKTPPEALSRANIAHAQTLGLRQSNSEAPVLRVIANGPSSIDAPLDGPTLALNGAYNLFMNSGRSPTMWAACDPQGLVADFLPDTLSPSTLYLPASKCDPKVFSKLQADPDVWRNTRIWDVSDYVDEGRPVPCASSITLCALSLMLQRGWSRFEVWGWDCSYLGDRHHAHQQHDLAPEAIQIQCDGRDFVTTRTWLAEAEDAGNKIMPIFKYLGIEVVLKGDGFLKTYLGGSKATL